VLPIVKSHNKHTEIVKSSLVVHGASLVYGGVGVSQSKSILFELRR
jgi:hypothetical protein